jgi:hypothetical protein
MTIAGPELPRKNKPKLAVNPPGYAGAFEEGDRVVDNPYALLPEAGEGPQPKTQPVKVNLRETPIEHMWARGLISREEKAEADWFRGRCEAARIGGPGVIDPQRIKVDMSGPPIAVAERSLIAASDLAKMQEQLGMLDYDILVQACEVGRPLAEIVQRWYMVAEGTRLEKDLSLHIGRRVRDALAMLVKLRAEGDQKTEYRKKPTHYRSFSTLTTDKKDWTGTR